MSVRIAKVGSTKKRPEVGKRKTFCDYVKHCALQESRVKAIFTSNTIIEYSMKSNNKPEVKEE